MSRWGKHRVDVSCDICNKINNVSLTSYNNSLDYGFYSCNKCKSIKIEMTNLEKYGSKVFNNVDKRNNTLLSKYGCYYNNRDKARETCNEKYDVDNVSQLESIKLVKIETTQKNYGVDNPFQSEEIKERNRETHLNNLGVDHPSKSEEIKKKKIETCLKNLGVEHPTQSEKTISKIRENNLEKYGTDWYTKTEEYLEKVKISNNEKYGTDWYMNTDEFIEKSKVTNLEKYGTEFPTQNMLVFNKQQKAGFSLNEYNNLRYRGSYELDFIKYCEEKSILIENGPTIKFTHDNKNKVYFSDFYIPEYNLIVEIKSSYYYNLYIDLNVIKMNESIKNGYDFIFLIDKDYTKINELFNI
jgi:hypothetical protein